MVTRPGRILFVRVGGKNSARRHYSSGGLINHLRIFSVGNEEFDTNTNACKPENDAMVFALAKKFT